MVQELIIGRERGVENPRLAVIRDGKPVFFGKPGSVPKNVSREHCRVTIDAKGEITVEDITQNNFMFVNGTECKKRGNVHPDDVIELGPDRFRVNLGDILKMLSASAEWHIGHLQKVYDDYQAVMIQDEIKRNRLNAFRIITPSISVIACVIAFVVKEPLVQMIGGIISVLFMLGFAALMFIKGSSDPVKRRRLQDDFRDRYVCPNPSCGCFLGQITYKELLKRRSCPHCKGKFVE